MSFGEAGRALERRGELGETGRASERRGELWEGRGELGETGRASERRGELWEGRGELSLERRAELWRGGQSFGEAGRALKGREFATGAGSRPATEIDLRGTEFGQTGTASRWIDLLGTASRRINGGQTVVKCKTRAHKLGPASRTLVASGGQAAVLVVLANWGQPDVR